MLHIYPDHHASATTSRSPAWYMREEHANNIMYYICPGHHALATTSRSQRDVVERSMLTSLISVAVTTHLPPPPGP